MAKGRVAGSIRSSEAKESWVPTGEGAHIPQRRLGVPHTDNLDYVFMTRDREAFGQTQASQPTEGH